MSPTSSSAAHDDPFRYRDFGNLATIGRSKAVIDWGRLPAQRLRRLAASGRVAHIWFLVGFRSRMPSRSAGCGTTSPYQRSARLITGETPPTYRQPRSAPDARKEMRMTALAKEVAGLGQTVLVLQGGGALGAYQVGVYEALDEAGIAPNG